MHELRTTAPARRCFLPELRPACGFYEPSAKDDVFHEFFAFGDLHQVVAFDGFVGCCIYGGEYLVLVFFGGDGLKDFRHLGDELKVHFAFKAREHIFKACKALVVSFRSLGVEPYLRSVHAEVVRDDAYVYLSSGSGSLDSGLDLFLRELVAAGELDAYLAEPVVD